VLVPVFFLFFNLSSLNKISPKSEGPQILISKVFIHAINCQV
jgi:hypothetical protein